MKNYTNVMIRTEIYNKVVRLSIKSGLPKTRILGDSVIEYEKRRTISPKEFWEGNDALFKNINLGKKKVKSEDLNIENAYL